MHQAFNGPADPEVTAITRGKDAWPVSEAMAQYLFRLILALRPRSVLEFGAGWSSIVIARALSRVNQGGRLTSLDNTDRFCGTPWKEVRTVPNVDPVLSISDLRLRVGLEGLSYTYAAIAQVAARRGPFDFLFIDAPPGVLRALRHRVQRQETPCSGRCHSPGRRSPEGRNQCDQEVGRVTRRPGMPGTRHHVLERHREY